MKKIILLLSLFVWIISCKNSDRSAETIKATDSTVQMQGEPAPEADAGPENRWEMNNYNDSLKPYWAKITYGKYTDTLHGYTNGQKLFIEGDIMLDFDTSTKGVGTTHNLWPVKQNKVVVPYTISDQYPNLAWVNEAIKWWEDKVGVDFVKRTTETEYVEFAPSTATRSYGGRVGYAQQIELADWARTGNIAHEMGHALGLYHEQSRSDRDNFVNILCPTDVNYRHAYKKDPYATDVGAYNYGSIMHYPVTECMTLKKDPGTNKPGQRTKIADSDAATIKKIYKLKD